MIKSKGVTMTHENHMQINPEVYERLILDAFICCETDPDFVPDPLSLLVLPVKDQAVALGGKCDEEDSVQKRLELVAPASNSRPFVRPLLRVNGGFMKIDDTVGVAVRGRGLPDLFVQKNPGPAGDACSEVGVDVVGSPPLSSKYS
jgi:hypothetical protein